MKTFSSIRDLWAFEKFLLIESEMRIERSIFKSSKINLIPSDSDVYDSLGELEEEVSMPHPQKRFRETLPDFYLKFGLDN